MFSVLYFAPLEQKYAKSKNTNFLGDIFCFSQNFDEILLISINDSIIQCLII